MTSAIAAQYAAPTRFDLGAVGDVDRRLGERVLRLGQPDVVERLGGRDGDLERARVRVARRPRTPR